MKLPFFKKSKPAPAPETPAAPRAPFPFAAPEQDEPVPAIHIDAHVLAFLRKYGLDKDFKLNIEANHATLAGHAGAHRRPARRDAARPAR